jgi:hypothetical protein
MKVQLAKQVGQIKQIRQVEFLCSNEEACEDDLNGEKGNYGGCGCFDCHRSCTTF